MEFIDANFINTTTQLTVDSNTALASNLFNRDQKVQYITTGFSDDLTTSTLVIAFDATTTVSRLAIMNHNLQSYTIYFNGATASTFSMSTTSDTTSSDYSSNSETSQYLFVTPQACTSVSIDMKQTIVADNNKAVGLFIISDLDLDFERIASAKNYRPQLDPKDVTHKLSDGGTRIHTIQDMYSFQIKYKYITEAFRNNLRTVFDAHEPFIFVPFGTTTSWDGIAQEVVWTGAFKFFRFSDNAVTAGFSGAINLKETPI